MKNLIKILSMLLGNNYGQAGFMGGDGGGGGDPDGGDGGDGGGNDGGGSQDNDSGGSYNYPDGMDEGLHGNKSLIKFADDKGNFNYANLMKSYAHMEGLLGKDKVQIPDETFTDEQWGQFYDKLGRPAKEEYGIKNNVSEGIEDDKEFTKAFGDMAHSSGLLPKQAQKMLDFFNESVGERYKNTLDSNEADFQKSSNALKEEYGHAYDSKLRLANHALDQFATEEQLESLQQSGMLDNPLLTRLFVKIGEGLKEDSFNDDASHKAGMAPDEIDEKIASFYKEGHAFVTEGHPNRQQAMDQMLKLQKMKESYK